MKKFKRLDWRPMAPIRGGPSALKKRFKGDDEGCFKSALTDVRTWGGVLEHPEASHAWAACGLARRAREPKEEARLRIGVSGLHHAWMSNLELELELTDLELEEAELDREIVAQGGLKEFVPIVWSQLEPDTAFKNNWHVEEIAEHLEAVTRGELLRLIINMPPGAMKSLLISVMWPLWVWTFRPGFKWIFASYESGLSLRDARKMRNVIESTWWRARWPEVFIPVTASHSVKEFDSNKGGFRYSTSVSGSVTGRHADAQVVDDPIKPLDTEGGSGATKVKLEQCLSWWRGTMSTRMADPKKCARVIVMQRLHQLDLSGAMLRHEENQGEEYQHLRLPMRFESGSPSKTIVGGDRRTKEGELLWPDRFGEAEVKLLEKAMQSRAAASQLQQRPTPDGGAIFKKEWFRYWGVPGSPFEELPKGMALHQSWDCAFKGEATSDFVVGQVWGIAGKNAFLLHQVRGRMTFTETCAAIVKVSAEFPTAWVKLIEDKANGPAVCNVLEGKVVGLKPVNPQGGKDSRANAIEPVYEAGCVWHPDPKTHPWVEGFEEELTSFPAGVNDDQVDAMTQGLLDFAKGNRLEELRRALATMKAS